VAIDTLHVVNLMLMMVCTREFLRQVASAADFTGLSAASKARRMWIMTIAATDTSLVHTTLQERTVYIHLVLDLAVRKIEILIEKRWAKSVEIGIARCEVVGELTAS
jgi:hypothetical protein